MKKRLTLTVAVFLCLAQLMLLAGCKNGKKDPAVTTPDPSGSSQVGGTDENGYQMDDLGSMDYHNEQIDILYWSDRSCQEFVSAGKDSDIVNNSIFDRNAKVQSRMNVTLNFAPQKGNYENRKEFSQTVQNDALNDRVYDMYACYGPLASTFAMAGYTADMNSLDHLNFDQPWWPGNIVSNLSLGNKLYFATGDVSTNLLWMMQIMLFNNNLKTTKGIEKDFYRMVQDGEWTLSDFMEICTDIYTGAAGAQTLQDTYGLVTHANVFDAFVIGAGVKAIDKDESDMPVISSAYSSERMDSFIATLSKWLLESDDVFIGKAGGGKNAFTDPRQLFEEGKSLFIVDKLYIVQSGALRDMADKFGILPMPMYEGQTEYYTDIGNTHTQYCIASKTGENANMCAAVLECMASESYRQVIPVVYAKVMKVRYGVDAQTSQMYDLLRDRITFDFGKIFQMEFSDETGGNSYTRELYIKALEKGYNWNTQFSGAKGSIEEKLLNITIALG